MAACDAMDVMRSPEEWIQEVPHAAAARFYSSRAAPNPKSRCYDSKGAADLQLGQAEPPWVISLRLL